MKESYSAFYVILNDLMKHLDTALVMCAFVANGESVDYINTKIVTGEKMVLMNMLHRQNNIKISAIY